MQGAERDASNLHERRCERHLMRRTSRAEADRRIGRPSVVRIDADSVAWRPNLNRARVVFSAAGVEWFGPLSRRQQLNQPSGYGGFLLMP
jgi:hypothetical protein